MKKIRLILVGAGVLILLGACGSTPKKTAESSETAVSESTQNSSTENNKEEKSVFSGVLMEDAVENETDNSIRLTIIEVKAEEDPENIIGMMKNDGVILNVSLEQLAEGLTKDELKKGDNVKFTLKGLPVMTMSIPPQVAGNAVQLVEKNN